MPTKKRKAEEAVANDDNDGVSGSSGTTPAKKSKKEAAAEAKAKAKAWRDSRRQLPQPSPPSSAKTTAAATTKTTPPPSSATSAPFSTGTKSPKRATTRTRRTPVKRGGTATAEATTARRRDIATDFQFDAAAVNQQQTTATSQSNETPFQSSTMDVDDAVHTTITSSELREQLPDKKKKMKQLEGKARIDELRKKRLQSGLKVTSPPISPVVVAGNDGKKEGPIPLGKKGDEKELSTEAATPSVTKIILVSPGKVGLSLCVNGTHGNGATITNIDPKSRYQGQLEEGDIILTIDGHKVTTIQDLYVNQDKERKFGIFSKNTTNTSAAAYTSATTASSRDPPPSDVTAAEVADVVSNKNKAAVVVPPSSAAAIAAAAAAAAAANRILPVSVANIFSSNTTITSNNNNYNAHRPGAGAKYDPNQPFPEQGYKMSTASYCGCGPTPSNNYRGVDAVNTTSTITTAKARSRTALRQLRESIRNIPAVKRASDVDEDAQKMPADESSSLSTTMKPSPPGKLGSAPDVAIAAAAPVVALPENNIDSGMLKASISRAHQLISSVAFTNRQRRENLGIKSASLSSSSPVKTGPPPPVDPPSSVVPEGRRNVKDTKILSPLMKTGPPSSSIDSSSSVPVGSKANDKREAEESTFIETHEEEDSASVSFFTMFINRIYILLKLSLLLPVVVGAIYVLGSMRGDDASFDSTVTTDDSSDVALEKAMCFIDYPNDFYFAGKELTGDELTGGEERLTEGDDVCGGSFHLCPQWGRCHGGQLRDCNVGGGEWGGLSRFVPNEAGTSCVPSDGATIIGKVVQDALVNMTVSQSCRSHDMITDPKSVLLGQPHPLFSLDVVSWRVNEAADVDITLSADLLLWLKPVFEAASAPVTFGQLSGEDVDPPNAIGLSSEVPDYKLPVPLACQLKFVFMELFGWTLKLTLKLLHRTIVFLARKAWWYISTHPKSSPVILLVLLAVVNVRRKKKHRAKVREIFDVVKEEAYDRLAHCDGSGGYAALHLRDDVGHAMYPSNVRDRLFMYNYVWPRIIVEVRADNRVRKFSKVSHGKQLEHWDLNTNSKRGWQLRKTPIKATPNKNDDGIPVVEAAIKRDP